MSAGDTVLYFSYGSNMSVRRLRERVPSASPVGMASLPGHVLRFHKSGRDGSAKCDAHETRDITHSIMGVVYAIAESEKPVLDEKEGLGRGYNEKTVVLSMHPGKTIMAYTYFATDIDATLRPFHWYKHHVLSGALENGLPGDYVKTIEGILSIPDPEPARHMREMAIYLA